MVLWMVSVMINFDDNYTYHLGSLSITQQHRFINKIWPTKNVYRSQTKSSLLSLASPHVILVEYGALTLALHSTIKNPEWVPDGDTKASSLRCSKSTRRVYPQSTIPVENGDPKWRLELVSAMLCNRCKPCCNIVPIYNKALFLIFSIFVALCVVWTSWAHI